jgi:DNA recombination-dependent growth factor C
MSNDARFKRKKHGHVPGDLSKRTKIAMREGRMLPAHVTAEHAKAFRRDMQHNQRAQLKRRQLREMRNDVE